MRLAKPKFFETPAMSIDPADEFASDIQSVLKNHTGQESVEFMLSDFLLAPQSIDNIYLGETFTFYVAVLNSSDADVCTNISIEVRFKIYSMFLFQVCIQTQTQKIPLISKFQDANAKLDPRQTLGQNITHEIKEIGQHM